MVIAKGSVAIVIMSDKTWIVGIFAGDSNGCVELNNIARYDTTDGKLASWTGHSHPVAWQNIFNIPFSSIKMFGPASQEVSDMYFKSRFAPPS